MLFSKYWRQNKTEKIFPIVRPTEYKQLTSETGFRYTLYITYEDKRLVHNGVFSRLSWRVYIIHWSR